MEKGKPIETVTCAYFNFPSFIERLRVMRGDGEDVNINETIIILSTTVIESVVADLLIETIINSKFSNDLEKRAYNALLKRISKANWTEYNELSEIVLGTRLSQLVEQKLWNSISILFQLRNQIVHGNPIVRHSSSTGFNELNYPTSDNSNISSFLLKQGIITEENPANMNTKIAEFFWENTKEFVLEVSVSGMNEKNEVVSKMLADIINTH